MDKTALKSAGMIATIVAVLGVLSWVAFTPDGDLRRVTGTRADEGDVVIMQETEMDTLLNDLMGAIDVDETTRINIIQEAIITLQSIRDREQ